MEYLSLCFSSTLWPLPVYQNTYSLTCCFPFIYHVASCKNFFKHHNITESILGGRAIARLLGDGRQDCRGYQRCKCVQRARGLGISENSPFEFCFCSHVKNKLLSGIIVQFQKNPYPLIGRLSEIPWGGRFYIQCMKLNWNVLGGGGAKYNTFLAHLNFTLISVIL